MKSKSFYSFLIILLALVWSVSVVQAQDVKETTLFTNVKVFNGVDEKLLDADVLVEGNLIKQVSKDIKAPKGAQVIDGKGSVLMPGLIDAHWHTMYIGFPLATLANGDMIEAAARAVPKAKNVLMRGFTTVRDMGGPSEGLKTVIDEGVIPGPRILPSGPGISQTSGHFDYRQYAGVPFNTADPMEYWYRTRMFAVADGKDEMIRRVRENLRMGAAQIKLATGGGVSSVYDPLDVAEYTLEEIKAAVDVATDFNTYVATHVMTDRAIMKSIEAGVKSIEHGYFASDETLQLMAKKGIWLCPQPFFEGDLEYPDADRSEKFEQVVKNTARLYQNAKKYGVKLGFGTDLLMNPPSENQGAQLARLATWMSPYEVLKIATSENAKMLEMSGPRHPYKNGPLGVIKEGAYADIILVNGNPLENLDLVADAENNFVVIMKDGNIYKNIID
ncbi:MAG TPA: hydrolase [Cytophagales bacterium]|jgi:imidazolonepropionase-like amidohydrolase|nr:hydrolase [Cytophagales bacterium]